MRKIKKLNPIPDNLNLSTTANRNNRATNLRAMRANLNGRPTFRFPGYENSNNKFRIRGLADGCCAYCGVNISGEQSLINEHYRPKKELKFRVNECRLEGLELSEERRNGIFLELNSVNNHGYFLWGDDYNNLFPSCNACNTGEGDNGIYVKSNSSTEQIQYNIAYGKKNFFPIYYRGENDPRLDIKYVSDISKESPLLFNPYVDDPEEIFSYKKPEKCTKTDDVIVKIKPNPQTSRRKRLKAEVTINLLGLNRRNLCLKRQLKRNNLSSTVLKEFRVIEKQDDPMATELSDIISRYLKLVEDDAIGLYGYASVTGKKLGEALRNFAITHFQGLSGLTLSSSSSFQDICNDLKRFKTAYPYIWTQNLDAADDLID